MLGRFNLSEFMRSIIDEWVADKEHTPEELAKAFSYVFNYVRNGIALMATIGCVGALTAPIAFSATILGVLVATALLNEWIFGSSAEYAAALIPVEENNNA